MRSWPLAVLLALGMCPIASGQTPCEKTFRSSGSLLKGKSYHVETVVEGAAPSAALDQLTAALPAHEISVDAMDHGRGVLLGTTRSAGQRPYAVRFQAEATPSGTRIMLTLKLPLGAFAGEGLATELCAVLASAASQPRDAPAAAAEKPASLGGRVVTSLKDVVAPGQPGEFRHGTEAHACYDSQVRLTGSEAIRLRNTPFPQPCAYIANLVHPGVDLPAPQGTPVKPIADGVVQGVVDSPENSVHRTLGYAVLLKHQGVDPQGNIYSLYLHLDQKPQVTLGTPAYAGATVLGHVGRTGTASDFHLHLEVRRFAEFLHPRWANIYGFESSVPGRLATFESAVFAQSWLDPEALVSTGAYRDPCEDADRLITKDTAGSIQLGITVAQMRRELPAASFARTTDGGGMALIEIKEDGELSLIAYAGEEDFQAPLDEQARVDTIWVYGTRYRTAEGVCPGMLVAEVAKRYGAPELTMSEIEMREYADFPGQPAGMTFRVQGGSFPDGRRRTSEYDPSASIQSILIYK